MSTFDVYAIIASEHKHMHIGSLGLLTELYSSSKWDLTDGGLVNALYFVKYYCLAFLCFCGFYQLIIY